LARKGKEEKKETPPLTSAKRIGDPTHIIRKLWAGGNHMGAGRKKK